MQDVETVVAGHACALLRVTDPWLRVSEQPDNTPHDCGGRPASWAACRHPWLRTTPRAGPRRPSASRGGRVSHLRFWLTIAIGRRWIAEHEERVSVSGSSNEPPSDARAGRWDAAYEQCGVEGVSWYQPVPTPSLELIKRLGVPPEAAVIDIGGGASLLADNLVGRGFADVTVLDISGSALDASRHQSSTSASITFVEADLLA